MNCVASNKGLVVIFAAKQVITFTQKLEDIDAKEKDTMATFECETNEPFVKVKWLKNNMEIFSGDKYRMHSDRKVHFLSVLMIDMRDDAEFTCVVVDDDVRTTAKLNVEGGLANDWLRSKRTVPKHIFFPSEMMDT